MPQVNTVFCQHSYENICTYVQFVQILKTQDFRAKGSKGQKKRFENEEILGKKDQEDEIFADKKSRNEKMVQYWKRGQGRLPIIHSAEHNPHCQRHRHHCHCLHHHHYHAHDCHHCHPNTNTHITVSQEWSQPIISCNNSEALENPKDGFWSLGGPCK